jgi:hypothetical protein
MRHAFPLALLSLGTVLAACGGGGDSNAAAAPDADDAAACLSTGRGDTYTAGLVKQGATGQLSFKLMGATPSPPQRYLNEWTLEVTSMKDGTPTTGADLTITPWMPDHQHGAGAYTPKVQEMTNGQYDVKEINTWMPGYWEVTVKATAGSVEDTAVYKFCISA